MYVAEFCLFFYKFTHIWADIFIPIQTYESILVAELLARWIWKSILNEFLASHLFYGSAH